MNNMKCCIAKDLMPLYIDDVLSEGSAQELRNHLQECESCRREYEALKQELVLPSNPEGREEDGRTYPVFPTILCCRPDFWQHS